MSESLISASISTGGSGGTTISIISSGQISLGGQTSGSRNTMSLSFSNAAFCIWWKDTTAWAYAYATYSSSASFIGPWMSNGPYVAFAGQSNQTQVDWVWISNASTSTYTASHVGTVADSITMTATTFIARCWFGWYNTFTNTYLVLG